jgi:hypoxanthine phosphoribosyltransferase
MDDHRHSRSVIPDVLVAIEKGGSSSARRIAKGALEHEKNHADSFNMLDFNSKLWLSIII